MKLGQIEILKLQGFKLVEKDGKKFIYANIDETRGFYADKTGRYYTDLAMFETPNSEHNDYAVSESKTKEELDDKELQLPIIGNFKNWKAKEDEVTIEKVENTANTEPDALPF